MIGTTSKSLVIIKKILYGNTRHFAPVPQGNCTVRVFDLAGDFVWYKTWVGIEDSIWKGIYHLIQNNLFPAGKTNIIRIEFF